MKTNLADTQLGVQFRIVEFQDADILALVQDPAKLTRVTDCVNADRRQKVALVDARYDLSVLIHESGFERKYDVAIKDGEEVKTPAETENTHIKRFIDALVDGSYAPTGFTLPSGDDKTKEIAALAYLQKLAFTCGDKTDEAGNPCYTLDINKAVRKAGTGLLPKWALEAAAQIIKNGNQASWAEKFAKGYTSARGIVIDPIAAGNFQQVAASNATAEEIEAVHQSNVKNLAKACVEARRQETEKMQPEFA